MSAGAQYYRPVPHSTTTPSSPLAERLPIRGEHPRILIVRLSALGDIVFASSLLESLRQRWPKAHISWLVQQNFSGILKPELAAGGRLDDCIVVPGNIYRSLGALYRLRRQLAEQRFDWVLDIQGLFKSRVLAALAAGAYRIGFDSKEPGAWLLHARLPKGGDARDISSEYRYFATALTGQPSAPPRLTTPADAKAAVEAAMQANGLKAGFVALCPFTTRPQKHWFEAHWGALGQLLHQSGRPPCVIFGGPADGEAAARILALLPVGSINLCGQTRLADLPAWLTQAGLVIGVDTGLTHIGIAVGTPVIALFGSTRPYTQGANTPLAVLYEDLSCAPCKRKPTCDGAWTCMRQLSPARVAESAQRLLAPSA